VTGAQARQIEGRLLTTPPIGIDAISADDRLAIGHASPGEHTADGLPLVYDMDAGSIDLDLVRSGRCPLLSEHVKNLSCLLGAVVAAVPEDGRLRLGVRFAKGGLADEVWSRLVDGFPVSLSVGMHVLASETPPDGPAHITRWALTEISCVVLGHDPHAHLSGPTTDQQIVALRRMMDESNHGKRLAVRRRYDLDGWQRWADLAGPRLARMLGVAADHATDALDELVRERCNEVEETLS
jgi:hypothetical protein